MTDWLALAHTQVVVDTGQLDATARRALENAARKGLIDKWRGYWTPIPGASFGMGPSKRCYGPLGSQALLP